ncbi:hypothetical protein F25303_6800 [Fusarium sp. NRRL 25303]|nr:hypothetical protein F25303_6800 [Fusarium sp. NRRL 25303]
MALTCTTLYHQCQNLLDLHRKADAKYKITSDLCPETVIDLLKDTTQARIDRWHVRELEIWGSRNDWEDWRPWVPRLLGTCGLGDGFPTRHGLDLQDIQKYVRTALELWTFWRFDSEAIRSELEAGKDGFLKLILYNPRGMLGDQYGNYLLDDLDEFRNLKLFTLSVYDLALEELYLMHTSPNVEQLAEYVSGSFPASTEALYIWGRSDEYVDVPASDDMPSDILDSTLASLIESGVLENLKVVYLADFEMLQIAFEEHIDVDIKDTGPEQPILHKSVAAGLKAGVHVCTLMNRDDGGNWKSFPAKPDGFDLKTGPCYGERPASWRLNVQSGEWGPDCEGCGECMDCLAVYPAELWKHYRS